MENRTVNIEDFKKAVGKYPTGVCVITTNFDDSLWGFTANSFTSVSLEPPLVSFCLAKSAGSLNAFDNAGYFAVNILSDDQEDIARHFASKIADKFSNIPYKLEQEYNLPLLEQASSNLLCKKIQQLECGDHIIFIGQVLKTHLNETKKPLIYFAKSFMKIT
jgi:flavin reductase (DIM6/NTAB) family NADH-FMN oxidoreductase RutF